MRKLLAHFLILVMLMPGLACGPFMGTVDAKTKAEHAAMPEMEGCDGMEADNRKKDALDEHVFFKDCSKTDLFSADQPSFEKQDIGGKIPFTMRAAAQDYSPALAVQDIIRGPPPERSGLARTHPPVLLITQRLRV
ncbi:MAG: hypothetical protein HYS17_06640 [Micavibrio aeruginosavorus]|uniref:Lipoprotein n=1 Tax=Micavibrio aeruginosavorus TaxID=349221 RepID=A0A7T5R0F1_9BACT|nr:MAG: hypothetical protein HYS17_06640 [Micavibrio aeruginosavorus]